MSIGAVVTPEITLITKLGSDPTLSKRIFLGEGGALRSDGSQCRLIEVSPHVPSPRLLTILPSILPPAAPIKP
jgi:hypothetical protein